MGKPSEQTSELPASFSDREKDLALLLANRMNDAAYTAKTFYNMKGKYERRDNILSGLVVVFAGLLAVGSLWEQIPVIAVILLAILTSVLSFFSTYADFNSRAKESEKAGDAYNSIFKDFQVYYYLILKENEYSFERKKNELQRLLERYEEINQNTLATDDKVYKEIGEGDITSMLELSEEEFKTYLDEQRFDAVNSVSTDLLNDGPGTTSTTEDHTQ